VSWYHLPLTAPDGGDVLARFSPAERRFGVHAGKQETAIMLALMPEKVRRDKLENFVSTSEQRARALPILGHEGGARFAWATQDLNPKGAAGNAAAAKAEDGVALVEAVGRALAGLLQDIDRLPADTLRQR
jgi:creatinine amidohydrolase